MPPGDVWDQPQRAFSIKMSAAVLEPDSAAKGSEGVRQRRRYEVLEDLVHVEDKGNRGDVASLGSDRGRGQDQLGQSKRGA
jgi:hypothetical protein